MQAWRSARVRTARGAVNKTPQSSSQRSFPCRVVALRKSLVARSDKAVSSSRAKSAVRAKAAAIPGPKCFSSSGKSTFRTTVRRGKSLKDGASSPAIRSEEHTSELQSRGHLVCRLLLDNNHDYKANI